MEEVFRYLLETKCNVLFTDSFSFNTYVQLTRITQSKKLFFVCILVSDRVESVPIFFCNEIDSRRLQQFKYRKTVAPSMLSK
jgi:histone-lysine N-methyltransferase SETDB2